MSTIDNALRERITESVVAAIEDARPGFERRCLVDSCEPHAIDRNTIELRIIVRAGEVARRFTLILREPW